MSLYLKLKDKIKKLKDLPLLFFRLILAYGFYEPAMKKIENFDSIIGWFDSLGMPLPSVNAFLATATEAAGFVLLTLGLGTRIISIPLMIVMVVATVTVHIENGFAAGNNGFEIPLYYFLMLFSLLVFGPGKISLDNLVSRLMQKSQEHHQYENTDNYASNKV